MTNIDDEILSAKKEIEQLTHRQERLISKSKTEERKKRTRRLIERGAILESVIEGAADFTNEQMQALLINVFSNAEAKAKIENLRRTDGNAGNPLF